MRLIAIVGMTGSGKTTLAKMLENKGYSILRFGDITDDILKEKGLELTEENEKILRESLRKEHGMDAYAKLNLKKIRHLINNSNVAIDGLYSWEEYLFLKKEFPGMIVLCVYAPPKLRYERLKIRKIRPRTEKESSSRDIREIENLNKAGPIAMADYTILNTSSLNDLEIELKKFENWLNER